MLVLKFIGLVILFIVVSYILAELISTAVMLSLVYPYSMGFIVVYLHDKGHGFYTEPNEQARGYNIIIRVFGSGLLYVAGFILLLILIPFGPIKIGCLIGWSMSGFLTVIYEFCHLPKIGRLDRIEHDEEYDMDFAVFVQLDGEEFWLELCYWGPDDYPVKNFRYAVMRMSNYFAFYPLQCEY